MEIGILVEIMLSVGVVCKLMSGVFVRGLKLDFEDSSPEPQILQAPVPPAVSSSLLQVATSPISPTLQAPVLSSSLLQVDSFF